MKIIVRSEDTLRSMLIDREEGRCQYNVTVYITKHQLKGGDLRFHYKKWRLKLFKRTTEGSEDTTATSISYQSRAIQSQHIIGYRIISETHKLDYNILYASAI